MFTRTWARGVTTTYGYNNAGELASVDYADGTPDVTAIAYNGLGQLTGRSDAAGALVRQPRADGQPGNESWSSGVFSGAGVTRGYDGLGRPGSLAGTLPGGASVASVTMGYASTSGRLETLTGFGQSWTLQWLERLGQVREVTASSGMKSTRNFDALGRLSSITTQKAGGAVVAGLTSTYDALNRRELGTREDGTVWDYDYDPLGQVISEVRKTATGTVLPGFAFGYDFDSIGNRESATINGRTECYTPTALNTYTGKTNAGAFDVAGTAEPGSEVYLRGASGANPTAASRVEKWFSVAAPADNAAGPVRVTANLVALKKGAGPAGADVMVGGSRSQVVRPANETFTYDTDGNLTADGLWTYTWDGENRLISMTPKAGLEELLGEKFTYGYDGESRRVWTVRTGWNAGSGAWETTMVRERYLYDGWNMLAVFDDQNAAAKTFLWGPDLSGTMQGAGGVGGLLFCNFVQNAARSSMPFYDGNGNVLGMLGTDGSTVTARYEYGPFGEPLGLTGPAAEVNPFRWSTKFTDATGLVWFPSNGEYPGRYYDSRTGRWLSRDAFEEAGGPLYVYCLSDSVNRLDPFGLKSMVSMGVSPVIANTPIKVTLFIDVSLYWECSPHENGKPMLSINEQERLTEGAQRRWKFLSARRDGRQTLVEYDVRLTIKARYADRGEKKEEPYSDNLIKISDESGRSVVRTWGRLGKGRTEMTLLRPHDDALTFEHEMGHIIGHRDMYFDNPTPGGNPPSKPVTPNWARNLMSDKAPTLDWRNAEEILNIHGLTPPGYNLPIQPPFDRTNPPPGTF